jgi:hypothetical protein
LQGGDVVKSPAVIVSLAATLSGMAMQSTPGAPFARPGSYAQEAALALSALPEPMRAAASVHVLGAKGYEPFRAGSSGVNCLVERERPDTQEPICWDAEGSETIMPVAVARAAWRAEGLSEEAILRRISEGFASGRFRAPRRAGIAYMLSTENYVYNGRAVVRYVPHLMCYAPYLKSRDIGSTGQDPKAPWVLNEGSPHAYIIIATGHAP